jgi:hypothetical protein
MSAIKARTIEITPKITALVVESEAAVLAASPPGAGVSPPGGGAAAYVFKYCINIFFS